MSKASRSLVVLASCLSSLLLCDARRIGSSSKLIKQAAKRCPTVSGSQGWRECIAVEGCVYIPGQAVSDLTDRLRAMLQTCVKQEAVLKEFPSDKRVILTEDPDAAALRYVTPDGSAWLPLLVDGVDDQRAPKRKRDETEADGSTDQAAAKKPKIWSQAWSWVWTWSWPWSWPWPFKRDPYLPTSTWPKSAHRIAHILKPCPGWHRSTIMKLGAVKTIATNYGFAVAQPDEFLQVEYGCWRNVLSKTLRMPVQFEYIASEDLGNEPRSDKFQLNETEGLLDWQPPRWSASDKYGMPYDVGHLVMANHFDGNAELIEATNLMTNVVPQLANMNRYAWLVTEMITECAREGDMKENVFVIGGCVWPKKPDYIKGFGKMEKVGYRLLIPDHCWKIISTPKRGHVAFWIPNTDKAVISKRKYKGDNGIEEAIQELQKFVVSVDDLEKKLASRQTPQTFRMSSADKAYKPDAAQMTKMGWSIDCDMA